MEQRSSPAAYRRPSWIALVVVGGVLGTALRDWLETVFLTPDGAFPWATFAINVGGAAALGILLEWLTLLAPDRRRRRMLQLTLGTGLLGGFTSYSTFVLETVALSSTGSLVLAGLYALASVAAGFAATMLAMAGMRRLLSTQRSLR